MLVSASEVGSGQGAGYFDTNFIPKQGDVYVFMWPGGERKKVKLSVVSEVPQGQEIARALLDIASREVFIRTDV